MVKMATDKQKKAKLGENKKFYEKIANQLKDLDDAFFQYFGPGSPHALLQVRSDKQDVEFLAQHVRISAHTSHKLC
jgi:uncharacterized caspase-like protein